MLLLCRTQRGRIRRVNSGNTIIAIIATLTASLTFAEDFKTVSGKEYKDATVSRVEPDGIVLKSKSGISKVYFVELPKEVQERFHFNPAAVQQAKKINYEVSLKDYPGVRGGPPERMLDLTFDRAVPERQVVDKMLREALEHAVAADGSRDILAMAFLGDEVLSDTQYSGALVYRAAQRKIITEAEARGTRRADSKK